VADVTATTVRRSRAAPWVATGALASVALGLALVDPAGGPPVCPFRAVTGWDCPGCGGTRAVHQLLTGHLGAAIDLNLLAVLALPFLAWALWAAIVAALGGPRYPTPSLSRRWSWALVVLIAVFWVVRNVPGTPLSWLGTTT